MCPGPYWSNEENDGPPSLSTSLAFSSIIYGTQGRTFRAHSATQRRLTPQNFSIFRSPLPVSEWIFFISLNVSSEPDVKIVNCNITGY